MKKFGFLIPILLLVLFSLVGTRLFASGSVSPTTLVIIMIVFFGIASLLRPKNKAPKPVSDVEENVRGDFARDAFAADPQMNAKFTAALKDYSSSMPKAALAKLTKLAPQCKTDEEIYAVAVATAMVQITLQKYPDAIRQFNKALLIHPTPEHAMTQGSCFQRLGELKKARDAYQYALDLDPANIEARSSIATTYVAEGDYEMALEEALLVLEKDANHASSLATAAICYGLLKDPVLSKRYTQLAVDNGYNEKKITETISALKKR